MVIDGRLFYNVFRTSCEIRVFEVAPYHLRCCGVCVFSFFDYVLSLLASNVRIVAERAGTPYGSTGVHHDNHWWVDCKIGQPRSKLGGGGSHWQTHFGKVPGSVKMKILSRGHHEQQPVRRMFFASHEEKNISVKGGEIKDSASTILASVMVKRVLLRSPGQRRTQPLYEQTVEDVYGERRITMSSLSSRLTWDLPTKHPCKVERGDWSADHHGQGHDGSNGTVDGCDWWGDVWCHRSKTSIDTHSLELSLNCTLVDNKVVIKIIYNDEVQRWDTSQTGCSDILTRGSEWKHRLHLFNIFFCTHFSDIFTIRFESGAPCEDEAKRRLWRKALRWRTRGRVWWRVTRGWANLFKFGEYRWKERSGNSFGNSWWFASGSEIG